MPDPTRRLLVAALLTLVCCLGVVAQEIDPAEYDEAIRTIKCDCGCHPQSVKDCVCGRAGEMREEIRAMIAGGGEGGAPMTGEQVIEAYVARGGEDIRIAPTATGFNLVAWLGPLVGLLVASLMMLLLLRRWKRRPDDSEGASRAVPAMPADDPYRARLRKQLEDMH